MVKNRVKTFSALSKIDSPVPNFGTAKDCKMKENKMLNIIKDLCDQLSHYGEQDFTLKQLVQELQEKNIAASITGDDEITVGNNLIKMDGLTWKEIGHQYSPYKQWWPD